MPAGGPHAETKAFRPDDRVALLALNHDFPRLLESATLRRRDALDRAGNEVGAAHAVGLEPVGDLDVDRNAVFLVRRFIVLVRRGVRLRQFLLFASCDESTEQYDIIDVTIVAKTLQRFSTQIATFFTSHAIFVANFADFDR